VKILSKKKWEIPVSKNKNYTEEIVDYTHEGLGIAKVDNYPVFIEGAIKGEEVEFEVVKTGKKFSTGKLMKVLKESPNRVEIKDDIYAQSGTMNLQHLSYEAQLAFKKEQVENVFRKIAKMPEVPIFDTIGMESPYEYRNKAQVPVREINGELATGFFRKHSHDLVPLDDFIIQDPKIDQAIAKVREILQGFRISGYNESKDSGDLRNIIVRRGHFTGDIMIVLVTRRKKLPNSHAIIQKITEEIPDVVSIIQNINLKKTNLVFGDDSKVLYGEDYYTDQLFGFTFKISHRSFFQVNSVQTEKLYQTALDYAGLEGNETVIDAYSGIGTLSLSLAKQAESVQGIEIVKDAVDNAKENAEINGIDNVEFSLGKAEDWMVGKAQAGMKADAVFVDPPRKGLAEEFVHAVLELEPEKIIYVSCNPSTLARDVKRLADGGYKAIKVQPVDLFPQTYHVEAVVLLERIGNKN